MIVKRLYFFVGIFALLFIFSGCIEQPEFKGATNFRLDKVNQDKLSFNIDVEIFNPNNYKLKIRKSTMDLYIDDLYIGQAHLLDKYTMNKNATTISNVPVEVELDRGVFMKLLGLSIGNKASVRLEGKLKASARGWPVSKKIDETKEISLRDLDINLGGLFN